MEIDSTNQNSPDTDLLSISIFSVIVAAILSGIYYFARIGFVNPPESILKTLSICFFLILTPSFSQVLIAKFGKKDTLGERWLSFSLIILYCFILLILAGLFEPIIKFNLFPIFAIIGIIAFLSGFIIWFKQGSINHKFILIFLAVFFAFWAAGTLWGGRYLKPLFEENLSVGVGEGVLDTLYLSTTSQMISTYHIPTTGLDGIPYLKYHYGSQWIFAQVSNLLKIPPLQFYQLGYPVIFVPFAYFCMLAFVLQLRKKLNPYRIFKPIVNDYWLWAVFMVANIGFLPLQVQRSSAIFNGRQLYSESHAVALGILFLLFLLFLSILKTGKETKIFNRDQILLFLVILPVMTGVLGFIKISFAAIILALAGYFFLRLKLYQRPVYWLSLVETAAGFLVAFIFVSKPMPTGFSPLHFIRANVTDWEAFWFLIYFFWSWLFMLFWAKRQSITNLQELKSAFDKHDTYLMEIVFIIVIVGVIPGLIINLGGNAWYFSDIQKWVALSFLLAILSDHPWTKNVLNSFSLRKFWQIRLADLVVLFIGLSLAGSVILNFSQTVSKMVTSNLISRAAIREQTELSETTLPPVAKWAQLLVDNQSDLEKNSRYTMTSTLKSLSNLPLAEKQNSLLFIPQTNLRFWGLLPYCSSSPFVATALSGIALLDGLPDKDCSPEDFGYWAYNLRTEPQILNLQNPSELCSRAKTLGFSQIITINNSDDSQIQVNKIDCK